MGGFEKEHLGGPLFEHDCRRCRFLGAVVARDVMAGSPLPYRRFELYVCFEPARNPNMSTSVIARWSAEPADFIQSIRSVAMRDPECHPALIWAHATLVAEERRT